VSGFLDTLLSKWHGDAPVYLLAAATGLLVVALAVWPVRRLAHAIGAIDVPGGRHVHRQPTPRLGGVAVLAGVLVAIGVGLAALSIRRPEVAEQQRSFVVVLAAAVGICLLGVRDDVKSLSPVAKLAGLGLGGLVLVLGGVRIDFLELPGLGKFALGPFAGVATVVWVLACTNAVNLIDGVDGLGAGTSLVACFALGLVAHGSGDPATATAFVAIAGACGGFLLHNREPARIFLGDSGSLLLGFLMAGLSAEGCTKRTTAIFLVAALCSLAVPLLDSTQSFVRRFRRAGRRLGPGRLLQKLKATAEGDREHIHHRLLGRGHSHRRVARTLTLCALVPGLSALLLLPSGRTGWTSIVAAGLASTFVLWRLAAMPSALKQTQPGAEKDLVLPSAAPRRTPRVRRARQHETV
jgi:UDP-GlcNAc:undecaprenyl-phosphate GlcNAc-1-phosphate transferase